MSFADQSGAPHQPFVDGDGGADGFPSPPASPRPPASPGGTVRPYKRSGCGGCCQSCCDNVNALGFVFWGMVIVFDDLWCKGRCSLRWRERLERNIAEPSESVRGGDAVVTGANGGIGFHIAQELARAGLNVILACRNEGRGRAAEARINETLAAEGRTTTVRAEQCDVADLDSVAAFAARVPRRDTPLLIVNNAGIMATPYGTTKQGFEEQFGAMHMGHALLTLLLLPELRRRGGRVVCVGSAAAWGGRFRPALFDRHVQPPARWDRHQAYRDAKIANCIFAYALADRIERLATEPGGGRRVRVSAVHPGCIATGVTRNLGIPKCVAPCQRGYQSCTHIPAEEASGHVVHQALSKELDGAGESSRFFHLGGALRTDKITYDPKVRDEFWRLTVGALREWLPQDPTVASQQPAEPAALAAD